MYAKIVYVGVWWGGVRLGLKWRCSYGGMG
jgi:hypothetical protein